MSTITKYKQTEVGIVPEDWRLVRLKDVASFVNGRAYSYEEFRKSGTPIVRIQNLTGREGFVFSDLELENEKYIEKGDLIYAWSATFGPYIWSGPRAIYHYHIWKVICEPHQLDKAFFYYELKYISNRISNTGTGSIFTKAIAHVLSCLDSRIELNQQMNKTLEAIARAIFRHWFVDFEFPNEEGKPYKSSGGEMVYDEELEQEIPKGWNVKRFSEVIAVNPKRELKRGDKAKKVGMADLNPWQAHIENWAYEEYTSGSKFQNGDTLFAKSTISSELYIFHLSRSEEIRDAAISAMTGTSGRQRVPDDLFEGLPIFVPPSTLVTLFQAIASAQFNQITRLAKEMKILSQIRDSLLPMLLSGKIRVPVEVR